MPKTMPSRGGNQAGAAAGVGIALGLSAAAAAAAIAYGLANGRKLSKGQPLTKEQWLAVQDESRRISSTLLAVLDQVRKGGCQPELRAEVWPYLLRLDSPNADKEQRRKLRAELSSSYAKLLQRCEELEQTLESLRARAGAGVAMAETAGSAQPLAPHLTQFAEAQRIIVLDAVRTDFSPSGQSSDAGSSSKPPSMRGRHEGSMLPVGQASFRADGIAGRKLGRVAQEALAGATHLSPADKHAAGRLINLLSACAMHEPDTGYCQGMSDLAVPMLNTFEDDAMAFWCFERLLQRVKKNFRHDEEGIKQELRTLAKILERADPALFHHLRQIKAGDCFFAYRMIIVQLRREMSMQQAVTLWEMLWAEDYWNQMDNWVAAHSTGGLLHSTAGVHLGLQDLRNSGMGSHDGQPSLFLYFIAALTIRQRRRLIDDCRDQDDTMRLFNSMQADLWSNIRQARRLQRRFAAA